MTASKITAWPTEADLESALHGAIQHAFPWIASGSIQHQTKFSFKFGHKIIEVDGATVSKAQSRADIILYRGEQPLAVLELKRAGVALNRDDAEQGLSYARVCNPSPPLVVLTNGADTRFIETHTGQTWTAGTPSEEAFQALLSAAAFVATADLKKAIDTLMGTSSVWQQAVRQVSAETIAELTGSWEQHGKPFVTDFLIPRKATGEVLQLLFDRQRLVLLKGFPLAGKSNVLRELVEKAASGEELAVLYLEAGNGISIFQELANALSRSLEWPVTSQEARAWLMRTSKSDGACLVIAIDGLAPDQQASLKEIDELTSHSFGDNVRVVVELDDAAAEQVSKSANRRSSSAIGRRARPVVVGKLVRSEFELAAKALYAHRIQFMNGAQASEELRQPWILRAISANAAQQIQQVNNGLSLRLPPMLTLELIERTRERFDDDEDRRLFQGIAKAVYEDAQDFKTRSMSLRLEALDRYVVRRKTLRKHIEHAEMVQLIERGYLRPRQHASDNTAVFYVNLPELVASELAHLLAEEVCKRSRFDVDEAARWLAGAATNLPLGDVALAHAMFDMANISTKGLPLSLIDAMLAIVPKMEHPTPGLRTAAFLPGIGQVNMEILKDGSASAESKFGTLVIPREEITGFLGDVYPWLVLSYLASLPSELEADTGSERLDTHIMSIVGTAPMPLRRPGGDPEVSSFGTHDFPNNVSIVCHESGMVEPITFAIFSYLARTGSESNSWIQAAIDGKSAPLITRIQVALIQVCHIANESVVQWASKTLEEQINPALKALIPELLH